MLLDAVKARIVDKVEALEEGRVHFAAELAELIRRDALPNAPLTAYVIDAGARALDDGSSGTGFFIQPIEETVAIVLVFNAAGDVTGARSVARADQVEMDLTRAIAGWMPDSDDGTIYTTDFRFRQRAIAGLVAGRAIYQLEYAIGQQLRILA